MPTSTYGLLPPHNDFNIYPKINLNYDISNAVSIQMASHIEGTNHTIGQQNVNRTFLDTRYFKENIPYMKPTRRLGVSLSSDITAVPAKLTFSLNIGYKHGFNNYTPYAYREGDIFIQRPTLLPSYNDLYYGIGAIWMALPGMQVRPNLRAFYKAFSTPAGKERFNSVQAILQWIYMFKNVQLQFSVFSPQRDL